MTQASKLNRRVPGLLALGIFSTATILRADPPAGSATATPAALASPAAPAAASTPPYGKKADKGFATRLGEAELEQLGTPVYIPAPPPAPGSPPPAPSRRIGDPPFDGPPFPDQDWQLGGGPNVIGDPGNLRDSPYPLMQALYDGPNGKAWYDSRIQIYGWWTVSGNISSSHDYTSQTTGTYNPGTKAYSTIGGPTPNFPEVYD